MRKVLYGEFIMEVLLCLYGILVVFGIKWGFVGRSKMIVKCINL